MARPSTTASRGRTASFISATSRRVAVEKGAAARSPRVSALRLYGIRGQPRAREGTSAWVNRWASLCQPIEAAMSDTDSLFAGIRDPEIVLAMKRAFDAASAAVRAWGACDAIFEEDEAEAAIAQEIVALAESGVADPEALTNRALSRFGAEALDRVAQNIQPRVRTAQDANLH